jgi:two-component system cell cycle sensor histidine kinase/response regulator CckA
MSEEIVARAFEPFFTTKGDRGTGLGLAVVHGIVHRAGGEIHCDSQPGKGTSFRITLPGASGVADSERTGSGTPDKQTRSRRVVLVDDDPLVRRAVALTLTHCGVTVDPCGAEVTVDEVESKLATADALVTDVVMPRLTGPDLVDQLRQRGCAKPVIFMTGYADHALLEKVAKTPNAVLVNKPFEAEDIVAQLVKFEDEAKQVEARLQG